jgi:hypothetical protein
VGFLKGMLEYFLGGQGEMETEKADAPEAEPRLRPVGKKYTGHAAFLKTEKGSVASNERYSREALSALVSVLGYSEERDAYLCEVDVRLRNRSTRSYVKHISRETFEDKLIKGYLVPTTDGMYAYVRESAFGRGPSQAPATQEPRTTISRFKEEFEAFRKTNTSPARQGVGVVVRVLENGETKEQETRGEANRDPEERDA